MGCSSPAPFCRSKDPFENNINPRRQREKTTPAKIGRYCNKPLIKNLYLRYGCEAGVSFNWKLTTKQESRIYSAALFFA